MGARGRRAALVERLKDPSLRPRLEGEILGKVPLGDWYNHYTATGGWDGMLLVTLANPRYQQFEGKRMSDVITTIGKPPIDVLFELLIENGGSVPTVFFHHSEEDMRYALAQPFVSIGSDGSAVSVDGTVGRRIRIRATTARFRACSAATCARPGCSGSRRPCAR